MTLNIPEMLASTTRSPAARAVPTHAKPKTFAAIAGAPVIPVGTPVSFDTSVGFWKPWSTGAANGVGTIRGIVHPHPIASHATNETLGVVMLEGDYHYDDIVLTSGVTTGNQAQLKTAVISGSPSLRELGIFIDGVDSIN